MSELRPKTSKILVFCAVAPPMGRFGRAFGFLVPATTTTMWPGFSSLALTVWAAHSVLGWNNNNNNNKKNPNDYNRDSALRARTPNKKILTITIGILHFVQEPLIIIKILTITIGILHFVQEPLIIKKILTITIGILHFVQEPLIIIKKILTITIGILHFVQEPLIKKILTITIGILHFVQEPLKSTSKSRKHFHQFDSRWCKCSQHKQIKKHTTNAHNTTKYILFAVRFFFGCVVSIWSVCVVKMTKVVFLICRCFFYLQRVSFFGCVVSIWSIDIYS